MLALFAYDGSPYAQRALRYAARLGPDLEVVVMTVSPALIEAPHTAQSTDPEQVDEGRRHLDEACGILGEAGVEAERVHAFGNPAAEILEAAEQRRADVIVVGQRGRGAIARFIEGSVADRIVRHATCDVLVVR